MKKTFFLLSLFISNFSLAENMPLTLFPLSNYDQNIKNLVRLQAKIGHHRKKIADLIAALEVTSPSLPTSILLTL